MAGEAGFSWPLEVFADGSTTPVRLNDASLTAGETYRGAFGVSQREYCSLQWVQGATSPTGSATSITVYFTTSSKLYTPTQLSAAFTTEWLDTSSLHSFATLPAGAAGTDLLVMSDLAITWIGLEIVVAAGSALTPFTLYSFTRR